MKTVVVGAGIVGVTIAYELQRRGRQVTLLDKDEPGRGASFGNMASIAVTEFLPASRPGIWRQLPGWMLNAEGPVALSASYVPRILPWFWKFFLAGLPARLREIEAAGAALNARAVSDLEALLEMTGLQGVLSTEGCLALYAKPSELEAEREHLALLERYGFDFHHLTPSQARELEPDLSAEISSAVLFPQNRTVRDPYRLVCQLVDRFRAMGGEVETGEVVGFDRDERVTAIRTTDGRSFSCQDVVLAAGAYTGRLSKRLGDPIPLETERGYHTQIKAPGVSLRHALIYPARAFMVSPTADGIRVGGTVEMAGLDAPPNYRRAKTIVKHARDVLPGLRAEGGIEWMGHRPALPDTVPVIGPSAKVRGVYYATGHGHLGLTQAATTARLLGDMVTGATPPLDMTPYRVNRF